MKYLFVGWAIFVAVVTFAIWLAKPGHPFYIAAGRLPPNHRITQQDLIPSPGADSPLVGKYVRGSTIDKWMLVWPQVLASYPTVELPEKAVPVTLSLPAGMETVVNQGSKLDAWTGTARLLENVTVLAVICKRADCSAIVSTSVETAQKIQAQNDRIQLFIRSY
jgi:hypothetical protein